MTADSETFKAAWIANMKADPVLLAKLNSTTEIRELQWQGTDFLYPAVRVSVDFMPSIRDCGPDDADINIHVYSEEKSSKQSVNIASYIHHKYHKHPFSQNGIRFSTVVVRKVENPERSIYAWETVVKIFCQGV